MSKMKLKQIIACNPTVTRGQTCQLTASPDGEWLLYGAGLNLVMRNISDPSICRIFSEQQKNVTVARFSPNGQWIAAADVAGKIKIMSPHQDDELVCKVKYEYHFLAGEIKDIAWCGDSKRICVVGDAQANCANAFMFDTGSKLGDFVGISKRLNSCDIRKQRPYRTVVGGDDFSSIFFEGPPVKFVKTNKSFDNYCLAVRFNHAGDKYAAAGANGEIYMFDGETGDNQAKFEGKHSGGCYAIDFSPDDSQIVTASADKTVRVWDANKLTEVACIKVGERLEDQQLGVVWSPSGQIISVSLDGTLNYVDLESQSVTQKIKGHRNIISSISRLDDGNFITGSGIRSEVFIYTPDFNSCTQLTSAHGKSDIIGCHSLNNGNFITVGNDNSARMGSADYNGNTAEFEGKPHCSDSAGGKTVIACQDQVVLLLDGEISDTVSINFTPKSIAISKFGHVVVSGDGTDTTKYFDASSGKFVDMGTIKINGGANAMAFNNAGTFLAVGDNQDKAVRMLDVNNKFKVKTSIFPHSSKIVAIKWSPDDKYIGSAELSENVAAWNTTAGKRKQVVKHGHRMSFVHDLEWQDNNTLISCGHDGLIKFWDVSF